MSKAINAKIIIIILILVGLITVINISKIKKN